ncbi:MAG: exodeoxyribonuclease VII small subunit [Saprospiraceae bacterium]|nr:exodeoxyribonuclease VII small subunit [Saprospiraceae bacterium]
MAKRKLTYAEAMSALEKIADKIKREQIPIEELPDEIKKARELLEYCNSLLRNIESELEFVQGSSEEE